MIAKSKKMRRTNKYAFEYRYGEITWDGINTAEVVNFCARYEPRLSHSISLSQSGKCIASGYLNNCGEFHKYGSDVPAEIPTSVDALNIEPCDTMRGSSLYVRIGETIETIDNGGFPVLKIKGRCVQDENHKARR